MSILIFKTYFLSNNNYNTFHAMASHQLPSTPMVPIHVQWLNNHKGNLRGGIRRNFEFFNYQI